MGTVLWAGGRRKRLIPLEKGDEIMRINISENRALAVSIVNLRWRFRSKSPTVFNVN